MAFTKQVIGISACVLTVSIELIHKRKFWIEAPYWQVAQKGNLEWITNVLPWRCLGVCMGRFRRRPIHATGCRKDRLIDDDSLESLHRDAECFRLASSGEIANLTI